MQNKAVLLTGGAGYIGSHTCIELLDAGYSVTILDNFCNSSSTSIDRVSEITKKKVPVVTGDIRDSDLLDRLFIENNFFGVVHFAGLKSVGESNEQPLKYYDNNVVGSLCLLEAMNRNGIRNFIFSSSATVYGEPQFLPLTEDHPLNPVNPYGRSKFMVEEMLRDLARSNSDWRIAILRYFNPVGAHASGLIGEDPKGVPNNLMPYIAQVAIGRREYLTVHGDDFATPDGTGVRDFIHVVDLARGHVRALEMLNESDGLITANLGTGQGVSVKTLHATFEKACGKELPYRVGPRRLGDVAMSYADPSFARTKFNWEAEHSVEDMCMDTWLWQKNNEAGFQ